MTIGSAIVDLTGNFPLKGVGEMNLTREYGKICFQIHIYEEYLTGNK